LNLPTGKQQQQEWLYASYACLECTKACSTAAGDAAAAAAAAAADVAAAAAAADDDQFTSLFQGVNFSWKVSGGLATLTLLYLADLASVLAQNCAA